MVFDIAPEGKLTIDDHSILSDNVYLCTITEIHFGKWSGIADNVTVRGSFHDIYAEGNFRQQKSTSSPINFGDDSGAGTHCVVLAGANIGEGVFIAANSVVPLNAKLEPYGVYAGSPVKLINKRR